MSRSLFFWFRWAVFNTHTSTNYYYILCSVQFNATHRFSHHLSHLWLFSIWIVVQNEIFMSYSTTNQRYCYYQNCIYKMSVCAVYAKQNWWKTTSSSSSSTSSWLFLSVSSWNKKGFGMGMCVNVWNIFKWCGWTILFVLLAVFI